MACRRQPHLSAQDLYAQEQSMFQRGELPKAKVAADEGLNKFSTDVEWAWRFRVAKGEALVYQGKGKDALAVMQESVPPTLATSDIAVRQLIVRGIANYQLQRFDDSAAALANAEGLASASHKDLLGNIKLAQGTLAITRGDFLSANRALAEAVQLARSGHNEFVEALALGNQAHLYLREDRYGEALDMFAGPLRIAGKFGNRAQKVATLINIGWCRFRLGDYERASEMFNEASTLAAELGMTKSQMIAITNIGSIHYEQREYAEAADYYKQALELARKLEDKGSAEVASSNLAAALIEIGHFDEAEKYNLEAYELQRTSGDASSEPVPVLNSARIAAGRHDPATAIKLLDTLAKKVGVKATFKWEAEAELGNLYAAAHDSARAERQYRTALATVDSARAGLTREEYRLAFLASASRYYDDYIDFLIANKRTDEALKVAEHSRARTLAEGLGLKTTAIDVPFKPAAIATKEKAVLLYYWLAPKGSYLWAVSQNKTEVFRLPSDSDIAKKVEDYRKALMGPRDVRETANPTGQQLYGMLVAPAEKSLTAGGRVIVFADGPLHELNFETLLVPGPQPHYWIEDAVVSNASSLALLASKRGNTSRRDNLLLIGNPKYSGPDFPPLPQAAQEVQRVEDHFAPDLRLVLAQDQAKPAAYAASKAGAYRFLHFVAHATASRTSPLDSSIILSKDGENSKLYARDIMQQPLSAELVTISACHSSGTKAYSGEGLVGLSWAFLRAGAHNVIAALWEVNDASTPQLMDALYSELGKGKDAATALRAAKLQMLHSDSIYRRPFYWAAFQLYSGS